MIRCVRILEFGIMLEQPGFAPVLSLCWNGQWTRIQVLLSVTVTLANRDLNLKVTAGTVTVGTPP
jgi:hypothetical protein